MNPILNVENKSFAELKSQRDALIESLKGVPVEDLAARFVQARMDAKGRDEKLAEQGRTITALQDALAMANDQVTTSAAEATRLEDELNTLRASSRQTIQAKVALADEAVASLDQQTERALRLSAVARKNHQAVSQAAKLLNDALAANAVDAADEGD